MAKCVCLLFNLHTQGSFPQWQKFLKKACLFFNPNNLSEFLSELCVNCVSRVTRLNQGKEPKVTKMANLLNEIAQNVHFWSPCINICQCKSLKSSQQCYYLPNYVVYCKQRERERYHARSEEEIRSPCFVCQYTIYLP